MESGKGDLTKRLDGMQPEECGGCSTEEEGRETSPIRGRSIAIAARTARLSDSEVAYYSRQLSLPNFGLEKQMRLLSASILVVGAGGLGSSLIPILAGVGVSSIGVVDFDRIERCNLHRQVIHDYENEGGFKAESAAERIKMINPHVEVRVWCSRLDENLANELFPNYTLIADCSDNFPTRLLISDVAGKYNKPVVSGSALRFQGQVLIYGLLPSRRDNYRSLLGEQCVRSAQVPRANATGLDGFLQRFLDASNQSCATAGIFAPVCGVIGSLMAVNICKVLLDDFADDPRSYNFVLFDFCNRRHPLRTLKLRPKRSSPVGPTDYEVETCSNPNRSQLDSSVVSSSWPSLLEQGALSPSGMVTDQYSVLCDVRPQFETDLCSLKGNVVRTPFPVLMEAVLQLARALRGLNAMAGAAVLDGTPVSTEDKELGKGVDRALNSLTICITGRDPSSQPLPKNVYVFCRRGIASIDACNMIAAARVALRQAQYNSPVAEWLAHEVTLSNVNGGTADLKHNVAGFEWVQILS